MKRIWLASLVAAILIWSYLPTPTKMRAQILAPILFGGTPAGGTFTLRYATPVSVGSGTGSTCPMSLTGKPIIAGDLLAYYSISAGGTYITSVSNGVFVPALASWGHASGGAQASSGYILSAAGETGTETITLSGSNAISCLMYEYSYTGTAQYDGGNNIDQLVSSTTLVLPTFTPSSGSNNDAYTLQAFFPFTAPASINSGFTLTTTNFTGYARLTNSITALGPTVTWSAPRTPESSGQMHFGFNVTPFKNLMFQSFAGSNGSTICSGTDCPDLVATTVGMQNHWSKTGSCTFTRATAASMPLTGPTGRLNDGSNTSDSSTVGMSIPTGASQCDLSWSDTSAILNATTVTMGFNVIDTALNSDTTVVDLAAIQGVGGKFDNIQVAGNGSNRGVQQECDNTGNHGFFAISSGTTFHIELTYNAAAGTANNLVQIYSGWSSPSSPGSLLSTISCNGSGGNPTSIIIGSGATSTPTAPIYVDSLFVSVDGLSPL